MNATGACTVLECVRCMRHVSYSLCHEPCELDPRPALVDPCGIYSTVYRTSHRMCTCVCVCTVCVCACMWTRWAVAAGNAILNSRGAAKVVLNGRVTGMSRSTAGSASRGLVWCGTRSPLCAVCLQSGLRAMSQTWRYDYCTVNHEGRGTAVPS